ncbi:tyrosine-type recombinase/integrase [bacterium]|nr:tyrosine-type recombinase/integrase [bacterium]
MKKTRFTEMNLTFPLAKDADEYLNHLIDRGLNFKSVLDRFNSLKSFLRWCQGKNLTNLSQVTLNHLHHYQDFIHWIPKGIKGKNKETVQQPSSIRKYLQDLKQFFNWCEQTGKLFENPAQGWKLGKPIPQPLADTLTESEMEKILSYPNILTKVGFRNRVMLEILYSTGIRRQELHGLDISDIDFTQGILNIRQGKGGKQRLVPIGGRALAWIRYYLKEVRPELEKTPNPALFISTHKKRLGNAVIRDVITKAKAKYKIKKWGNTHLIRHTMATLMLKNGADIRIIQEILGHKKIETTTLYTRLDISYLKKVHQSCHPSEIESEKSLLF